MNRDKGVTNVPIQGGLTDAAWKLEALDYGLWSPVLVASDGPSLAPALRFGNTER